jgi:cytochrome bd-type quinol oxidase subunit 1
MLNAALLLLLALALFLPPILLSLRQEKMRWLTRYILSIAPLAYTWLGWQLAKVGYDFFACQGSLKSIQECARWGMDFTPLVDHGFFLMISCVFFALPVSLWFLLNTAVKHLRERD